MGGPASLAFPTIHPAEAGATLEYCIEAAKQGRGPCPIKQSKEGSSSEGSVCTTAK